MRANGTGVHWFVTADGRGATLFQGARDDRKRLRLEPERQVENRYENDHERHRPSALGRGGGKAAPTFADDGHTDEEAQKRFARDVCHWLRTAQQQLHFPMVTVFAPPELLGQLRSELNGMSSMVELRRADLTKLTNAALASHPAVMAELEQQEKRERTH